MKRFTVVLIALMIAGIIVGCGTKENGETGPKGAVLAKIGDDVITLEGFNKDIEALPDNVKMAVKGNKMAYLDNVILESMLHKEALRRGLHDDAEVNDLLVEAKKKIMAARLVQLEVEDKVAISEGEIKDYYKENKAEFMNPELCRASHILVKTMDEAVEISDRLNAGAIFEELAAKHSMDVSSKKGGDIGYFSEGQLIPEIEDACIKLDVNGVSGPVKSRFGYHIVKLTDRRDAEAVELDGVKDKIKMILTQDKRRVILDELIAKLKSRYKLTINADLLEEEAAGEASDAKEL